MTQGFVYVWTDHLTNKLYVGSHKGRPDDGYICSSKTMLEQYKIRASDFTRQIIASGEYVIVRNFESKILASVDAMHDPLFYNMNNGLGDWYNKTHTEETKRKISQSNMGRKCPFLIERNKKPVSEASRKKMSEAAKSRGQVPTTKGIKFDPIACKNMSEGAKRGWVTRRAKSSL